MKRRAFLGKAVVGAGTTAAGIVGLTSCQSKRKDGPSGTPAVHTRPNIRWRLASSFPRGLDTIFGCAEVLKERVETMTDGRFRIHVHSAGELVPGLQVMDAVQQGSVQVGHSASYYYTGKNPMLAFDTCVPFGLSARQQNAWLLEGGGLAEVRRMYADFNIISFPGGNTGAQMGGWFRRQVGAAADLKGLKIRIPGLGGQVMSALGATVQVLAGGDIYPALERGTIDATEWVGPYDDEKLGFHKVAKIYYYPGWWEPGPSLSYLVNRTAWDKLPKEYQTIFACAASESAVAMQVRYDQKNPAALARLLDQGVQMQPFSDDVMRAAYKASEQLLAELSSHDTDSKKLYEQWRRARRDLFRWFATAELAYGSFAFRNVQG